MADAAESDSWDVEVVVWRSDGEAVLRLPELASVRVALDDEAEIGPVIDAVREISGLDVTVLELTEHVAHVELIGDHAGWVPPDARIPGTSPWNVPGWRHRVLEALGQHVHVVGPFRQHRHWSISAIGSVATTEGDVWWKQVPPFMAHEGAVTAWLHERAPEAVPDVIAVGDDWCLARPFPAPSSDEPPTRAVARLAELQQLTIGRDADLLALGCPDRRTSQLLRDLEALAGRDDVLDQEHRERLDRSLPALRAIADELGALGLPDTIVHGDLHGGNCLHSSAGWFVFDWTDACLAPPFFDLGLLLALKDPAARQQRIDAYADAWADPAIADGVRHAMDPAAALAGAHHAISYQRIVDGLGGPSGAEWTPMITAHLDRALDALPAP